MHLEDRLALYKYLGPDHNRQPSFLARNLRRSLAAHEVEVQRQRAGQALNIETACPDEIEHAGRISWEPPSLTMVNKAKKERLFFTQIKEFKPADYDSGEIYATAKEILLRCEIRIGIGLSEATTQQKISCPAKRATLEIRRLGTRIRASIKTCGGGFAIPTHDILKLIRTPYNAIELDITISLLGGDSQLHEIYGLLGLATMYPPPRELHAFHPNVLDLDSLPPDSLISVDGPHDFTIPLQYRTLGQLSSLGSSLKASLSWVTSNAFSILGAAKRKTRLRPPGPVAKHSSLEKVWNVEWKLLGRQVLRNDLRCLFCNQRHFNSIKELHLHLTTHHYHFRYCVATIATHAAVEKWTIECDLSAPATCLQDPEPHEEVQILRPRRPFDIEKHLQGDASWSREATLEDETKADEQERTAPLSREVPDLPPRRRVRWPVPHAPDKVKFYRRRNKRRLEEGELVSESDDDVDTEWSDMAKAHSIMRLPISETQKKFIIKWDEHVRKERLNSDKHLQDSTVRFVRLHGEWLCKQNLCDQFRQKISELLEDRLVSREIYDYCIHRLSKTAADLAARGEDGITPEGSPLAGAFSVQMNGASPMITHERSPRKRDKGKAKAKSNEEIIEYARRTDFEGDVEMLDAQPSDQRGPENADKSAPLDSCLCGEDALSELESLRELINCTNELCEQPVFHLDCVLRHWTDTKDRGRRRLSPRDNPAWLCRVCENRG